MDLNFICQLLYKRPYVPGECPKCQMPATANGFRDALSEREYEISGLCQGCQDELFAEGADAAEGGIGEEEY